MQYLGGQRKPKKLQGMPKQASECHKRCHTETRSEREMTLKLPTTGDVTELTAF